MLECVLVMESINMKKMERQGERQYENELTLKKRRAVSVSVFVALLP